jgi:nitrite reductase/ring-hydroxylating ferredoxin subunit
MKTFFPVVSKKDMIPGKGLKVSIKKHNIVLFINKNKIYAFQNRCPHQNADLADGYIMNDKLYCSLHHWAFNLSDGGYTFNPEMKLRVYETKTENDMIYIGLDD